MVPPLAAGATPSLSISNNCTETAVQDPPGLPKETPPDVLQNLNILQGNHKKTATLLAWTISRLAERFGIERLGFFTLTFKDHVTDPKEAQRRLHSLVTHVLNDRFAEWVRVFERQKHGRIHYHLVVVLSGDIRTGVDWVAFEKGDYRTAGRDLRAEWAFWRDCAPLYGFGRTELLPVKSTAEGIGRYVGKYISKHIGCREERDKGVRLMAMSKGARIGSTNFGWQTPGARLWRRKLSILGKALGIESIEEMSERFGPRWAYFLQEPIGRLQLRKYPDLETFLADGREATDLPEGETSPTKLECSWIDEKRITIEQAALWASMILEYVAERHRSA